MSTLTPDEWKKMIDELTAAMPEPQPMISAILYTNKDYLIPSGVVLQAEHESKTYYLMNKTDVDKTVAEIKRINPQPITHYDYQVGFAPSFVGIPVIEDTETIRKILMRVAEKLASDLLKPRPFSFDDNSNDWKKYA